MQTGYSGCLRQRLVDSPVSKSAAAGKTALVRHQFGTDRVLYKRVQSLGPKNAKQRFSRLNVSATKDLPLPVILDRDFDKEGSRVYKRTVRYRVATDRDKLKREVKTMSQPFAVLQVFTFSNWAAHRSTKRYTRHVWTIVGVGLLAASICIIISSL